MDHLKCEAVETLKVVFLNETNARLGYFMYRIHPNEIVIKTPHVHFEVRFIPLMCIENQHEPIEMVCMTSLF